ncbi:hypothetical protein EDC04DRAFT_1332012 [Pisolithus marmoratus]|nr:hypothetical protein EDC04DRAFT_1332012 [Pisolithus marmoratus]
MTIEDESMKTRLCSAHSPARVITSQQNLISQFSQGLGACKCPSLTTTTTMYCQSTPFYYHPNLGPEIKRLGMLDEKWAKANKYISDMVKKFQYIGMKDGELLVHALSLTLLYSPPEALLRASPNPWVCEELINDNPELVGFLQNAIKSGRYELAMSLRSCSDRQGPQH